MPVRKAVIFIIGPTAIGKTTLAIKLAERLKGEIISCDSMQVYKGMDILSQAPTPREIKKTRYHLIKFLSPRDEFNAARFIRYAKRLIRDIVSGGKVPIVVGGSGLYAKSLIDGLFQSPAADTEFRKKMCSLAKRYGSRYLHRRLQRIDGKAALLIHQNDTRRIIRALEIWHSTGKAISQLKKTTKGIGGLYDIKLFGLTAPRDFIYSGINNRVEKMIRSGALEEVRKICKKNLSKTARAMIGLKELAGFLKEEYDFKTAKELLKRNTRRFAKRQLTWFGADRRIRWFDVSELGEKEILDKITASMR